MTWQSTTVEECKSNYVQWQWNNDRFRLTLWKHPRICSFLKRQLCFFHLFSIPHNVHLVQGVMSAVLLTYFTVITRLENTFKDKMELLTYKRSCRSQMKTVSAQDKGPQLPLETKDMPLIRFIFLNYLHSRVQLWIRTVYWWSDSKTYSILILYAIFNISEQRSLGL